MFLPKSQVYAGRQCRIPRNLLHREEGIDLRLPQPQVRKRLSRNVRHTPVSSVSTACCWVDLDEIWS
jgi:hypothetical protein